MNDAYRKIAKIIYFDIAHHLIDDPSRDIYKSERIILHMIERAMRTSDFRNAALEEAAIAIEQSDIFTTDETQVQAQSVDVIRALKSKPSELPAVLSAYDEAKAAVESAQQAYDIADKQFMDAAESGNSDRALTGLNQNANEARERLLQAKKVLHAFDDAQPSDDSVDMKNKCDVCGGLLHSVITKKTNKRYCPNCESKKVDAAVRHIEKPKFTPVPPYQLPFTMPPDGKLPLEHLSALRIISEQLRQLIEHVSPAEVA